jgi:N-methylhydantoinase A/oxoprolinase/acetone carboxylase beta subunit
VAAPADYALFAFGGTDPVRRTEALQMKRRGAPVAWSISAFGLLYADVEHHHFIFSHCAASDQGSWARPGTD